MFFSKKLENKIAYYKFEYNNKSSVVPHYYQYHFAIMNNVESIRSIHYQFNGSKSEGKLLLFNVFKENPNWTVTEITKEEFFIHCL